MTLLIQIFLFVFLIVMTIGIMRKTSLRGKKVVWFLGGYVVILLVSGGLFLLIAGEQGTADEGLSTETVSLESEHLNETAQTGDPADTYLHEQWSFDYDEEQLGLEVPHDDLGSVSIYAEEKEENDQMVEAAFYQVPSTAEGQEANPHAPNLNMQGSTLMIEEPEPAEVEATVFEEPFPFYQFKDTSRFDMQIGRSLLFLRVPENLELNTTETVMYVDD